MGRHSGSTDRTNLVILSPAILRAYWSRRRAWNGSTIDLCIETRFIEDGTPIELDVWESDENEGSEDDAIEKLEGSYSIKGGRCVVRHKLAWDEAKLGQELASEGGEYEFYFRVRIARFHLEARSNLLYVDLGGYVVSG